MSQFIQRYLEYRRIGYGRVSAFQFAWLVTSVRRPTLVR